MTIQSWLEEMEDVENQSLQSIRRNQAMMSTKDTTFIIAPRFNQYDTAFKEMILADKAIDL